MEVPTELLSVCLQRWYSGSMKVLCVWLTDRLDLQLHTYQLKTLIKIVKVRESHGGFVCGARRAALKKN